MTQKTHIPQTLPFRWQDIPVLAYKEDGGSHFKGITRQVLFDEDDKLGVQLRYFEIAPEGHSTLERHDHAHCVMVVKGRGHALVGCEIHALGTNDLVRVPPNMWHQFRATAGETLGFLCLVSRERDKPERPGTADLVALRAHPQVSSFLRV